MLVRQRARTVPWLAAALVLVACGSGRDPVRELARDLDRYPEYTVAVDDLRVEESAFPDFFLRFRVTTAAGQRVAGQDTVEFEQRVTDWYPVSEGVYARYEKYVGMVVASKDREGRRTDVRQAHPPAYGYVGNPHYGSWGAGGFWQFYGQYAFMRSMLGGWQVSRGDWEDYRRTSQRGRPYFGPTTGGRPTFGSSGTVTQQTRPTFYQSYTKRQQSFATNARSRMGQTSSSGGRGSFRGK